MAATAGPAGAQVFQPPPAGAVYTQTNAVPNSVEIYRRSFTGALTPAGSVLTGGNGVIPPTFAPQGAVTLHRSNRILFVVNSGSSTVTSFLVRPDYGLTFASQVPSNGVLPASVTSFGNVVYVLNGASGNISGFTVNLITGVLTPIPSSSRNLAAPAGPAQISFDTIGRTLAVTERGTDVIETFSLGFDNRPGPPVVHPSNGRTPYGFAFTARNHMIVSNAGVPPNIETDSSVSSYSVTPFVGTVTPIETEQTGQIAACWVAVTPDARFAYVSNAFSSTVTRMGIAPNGTLTVLGHTPTAGFALDDAVSVDGRFLYVLTFASLTAAQIEAFQINLVTGGLTPIGATAANLPGSTQGLAAI